MLKRNYAYNVGDIEYSDGGIRLTCKTAGTTSIEDLVIPPNVGEVADGTVVWSLIDISGGGNDQVGTIIQYFGSNPPKGFLSCDGSIYNIVDYSRLANHIEVEFGSKNFFGGDGVTTFAVPDLRGEFLRGTGTNGATSISGRNVGYHQDATIIPNSVSYNEQFRSYKTSNSTSSNVSLSNYDKKYSISGGGQAYIRVNGTLSYESKYNAEYASTTRPTNTSVLYCIRW